MTRIVRLTEIGSDSLLADIEAIFFAGATTRDFLSEMARAEFRELWLSRYMRHFPDAFFIALDGQGRAAGYLAGSPLSDVPPLTGPDYYALFESALIRNFPAHLHINVRPDCRRQAIGAELIAAFRSYCGGQGFSGFHAVTADGSRAAKFFARNGLSPYERVRWNARQIVFMGEPIFERS